ncbi:oxidoreductase [Flexivirga endophytica]|uniref:Oxidoreductase n=1 Tax=Flexivirga endophytica TaxID=1849103 RepID=A0A916WW46_9MICO|nr:oxidoreductase [Flexivirga endophytica]GGB37179.1 oxidoreductase [Flexivirga endophytica]GHB44756.1 oxidoreductase [Flexivirga endophytica]
MPRGSIFDAAGGADGMTRIAAAWHRRAMADEVVAHAFHGGAKPDHVERLAAYLGEALGGPPRYTELYDAHATVVRIHSGNGEHEEMNRRAIDCFAGALHDAGVDADPETYQAVLDYWAWVTWHPMYAYHRSADDVPSNLQMPQWSWDGTVSYRRVGQ